MPDAELWWCRDCGSRMRFVVGGDYACPTCDRHQKPAPKRRPTETYRPTEN